MTPAHHGWERTDAEAASWGRGGLKVSAIGLGCMGMSEFYSPKEMDDAGSIRVIHRYLDSGGNFLDTADVYGVGRNEALVGKAIEDRRDKAVLATRFGNVRGPNGAFLGVRGDAPYVRDCCDASLKRLGVDVIDLYYHAFLRGPQDADRGHRWRDGRTGPCRQGALPWPVRGFARHDPPGGEGPPDRGAADRVVAVEPRGRSGDPLPAVPPSWGSASCAYSPLGRGFLTGQFKKLEDLPADDFRRHYPRFQGENFQKNLDLVKKIEQMAKTKGCTPSQLALAWVLAQGPDVVPIPGTKRVKYLDDNLGAAAITLTAQDLARIEAVFPSGVASGAMRYPEQSMKTIDK